jgi:hypothetical protein
LSEFDTITSELAILIQQWEPKLAALSDQIITDRRNGQDRNVRQIIGHMVDSASNNIHRIVHLQYQKSPLQFPDYASYGNNDRWIAIQNYQAEDREQLLQLWKFSNLHIIHVINNVDPSRLNHEWQSDKNTLVSLRDMIFDYLRHFKLHLAEMDELIQSG